MIFPSLFPFTTICAVDIEKNKVRGDLGIPYEEDVLRLIDVFQGMDLYVGSVVVTQYSGQPSADAFLSPARIRAGHGRRGNRQRAFRRTPGRAFPPIMWI